MRKKIMVIVIAVVVLSGLVGCDNTPKWWGSDWSEIESIRITQDGNKISDTQVKPLTIND